MKFRTRLTAALTVLGMAILAACGGGGGGSSGGGGGGVVPSGPTPTNPAPSPTNTSSALASYVCRSNGTAQSIGHSTSVDTVSRRMPNTIAGAENEYVPGVVEIKYRSPVLAANRAEASQLIQRVGGELRSELDASAIGDRIQVVQVSPGNEDDAIRQLRASSIVESATRSAVRRMSSTTANFTNDPYFNGFAPANTPPFYMSATVPGMWDMHVICAANAWGYGTPNTTGSISPGALGGTVRVAIIDTGADLTHPDLLAARVVLAETIVNGNGTVTSSGVATMHDNDGHGTDVAGIAAATGNNAFGFTGVAYNSPLMIFRVFPDPPPGGCSPGSTSNLCTASGTDVAKAITDAVAGGAKVINLSLGGSGPDTAEDTAVANAISAGVVVVAASGNETLTTLDFPARDAGVIAVGASSLDDSNPSAPVESVASYSNYSAANPAAWGIVAPGGDPSGNTDNDDFHWIENIYSSTTGGNFCTNDRAGAPGDCRVLIAGTSMATPHVTGAVALMLSVNGGLTPSTVKTTLCSTARNINNTKSGCGRLDVYRAVAAAVNDPSP
ncbi:MAG TPA: S8 family serine peptidase [Candidatus Rubrimentiphilum sp.]|nr:S8 family serine peptidase [Candidatus Rubrimentiphilum sp.]